MFSLGLQRTLAGILERSFGWKVFRNHQHGLDPLDDIRYLIKDFNPEMIFDVGANEGGSARRYRKVFPQAHIHSFEPVQSTYNLLEKKMDNDPMIHCHHLALGVEHTKVNIQASEQSKMSSLVSGHELRSSHETVQMTTVDRFCSESQIESIDYLKVDTEGHDLEVLKGAEGLIAGGEIDFIETECSMNNDNTYHVSFFEMHSWLEERAYVLFGLYEQQYEWIEKKPILRRANPLFVRKEFALEIN